MLGYKDPEIRKTDDGRLSWEGKQKTNYFKEYIEQRFVEETTNFYDQQSKKWIATMTCPEFTKIALESLTKEEEKVIKFVEAETRPQLITQLVEKIVTNNAEQLVSSSEKSVSYMLENNRMGDLNMLARLFAWNERTFYHIIGKLKPFIVSKGTLLREKSELLASPVKYVRALIALKKEMNGLVAEAFESREQFVNANNEAFENIMQQFELAPKFLAYYIDDLMRKELRGKENMMEALIEDAFELFKLLKAKDAFTEYHKVVLK